MVKLFGKSVPSPRLALRESSILIGRHKDLTNKSPTEWIPQFHQSNLQPSFSNIHNALPKYGIIHILFCWFGIAGSVPVRPSTKFHVRLHKLQRIGLWISCQKTSSKYRVHWQVLRSIVCLWSLRAMHSSVVPEILFPCPPSSGSMFSFAIPDHFHAGREDWIGAGHKQINTKRVCHLAAERQLWCVWKSLEAYILSQWAYGNSWPLVSATQYVPFPNLTRIWEYPRPSKRKHVAPEDLMHV